MNIPLPTKNKKTGKPETIIGYDLEKLGWGFHFFVASELNALKAAYIYRHNPYGVRVEFAQGVQRWMVTVFNEFAASIGLK